jgi:diguanylate cyclase (GGDEF)-like protein
VNEPIAKPVTIEANFPVDLSNCEREPIHIPGSIQPHGVLIVASLPELHVRYASANARTLLGIPVASILGQPLAASLGPEIAAQLVRRDESGTIQPESHRVLRVSLRGQDYQFDIRHLHGLLYLEIQQEIIDPRDEKLPANGQMLIDAIRAADTLEQLLHRAAHHLRKLTGYDRVMVYRFNQDGHGHVVAEDCDASLDPYLDLHYPASDIPAQARRLYLLQRLRILSDVDYNPVPMLADGALGAEPAPLDMTFCDLRSMSPIHVEYLKNMDVGATMTLSLIVDEQLWGLLVCHHREPKLPSLALRIHCDLLSQIISFMIGQTIETDAAKDAAQRKQMVAHIAESFQHARSIFEGLLAVQKDVLDLVGASGALVSFDGQQRCIGETPSLSDSLRIMETLRASHAGKTFASDSLGSLMPEFIPLRATASGVLLLSILGSPADGILWFRPEVVRTVKWGGDPDKPVHINPETGRIAPRKSFEVWKRLVELHSLRWQPIDLDAVAEMKRAISAFIMSQAESLLSRSNLVDTVTLLPNRRLFQQKLHEWEQRADLYPAAVILIGLDRFKLVNEAFGHTAGDDLLLQVARRLSRFISNDLLLARLGGDEFATLCTGMSAEAVDDIVRQIAGELATPFQVLGRPFRVTASIGHAHSSHGGEEELLRAADTAMHMAKRSGRNRSIAFDRVQQSAAASTLELEQDLYHAIERNEFVLAYQPIVSLADGTLFGFEALVRWRHPVRGLVPPLDFIPLAEENGLIVPIGRWVLREALRTLRGWLDTAGLPLCMHVNVAAPQLIAADFVSFIVGLLREYNLEPHNVAIEVTESVLMRDLAVDTLRELRNLGFGVSVDDFGTGYSSLAYLQKLPVDVVKIDRGFVRDIATQPKSAAFLNALVHLTQTLGLDAIAEGVENQPQSSVLLGATCQFAQGYWFAKPMEEAQASQFLTLCREQNGKWIAAPN